jgi:hypothetical protein
MIYTHGFLPQQQCMTSHLPAPVFPVHTPCTPAHMPYAVNSCHNHFNSCHNYYDAYHNPCNVLELVY